MRRTLTTLTAALFCILTASAQNNMDQHARQHAGQHSGHHADRQHFDQHFGVHFGTSDRDGHDRDFGYRSDYRHRRGIHMDTGVFFHRYSGGRMFLDVVHLKNGSEIIGVITDLVPGEDLRLTTYDGSTYLYDLDEVSMITKRYGRWSNAYRRQMRNDGRFNNSRGYFGIAEMGVGALFGTENIRPSLTIINGYRVCPQFAVGLGTGINWYEGSGEFTVPVFLHIRSDFFNSTRSPFLALNIGGQFSFERNRYESERHEGLVVEPSFGYGFNIGPHQRLNISLGIALETYKYWYKYDNAMYDDVDAGLNLKIGYAF